MNIDPYKCYRIKGKTAFKTKTVTLVDQFDDTLRETVLLKPLYLCNPSLKGDKDGGGMPSDLENPEDHLVCYAIRDVTKPRLDLPKVTTRNEIVPGVINVEMFDVKKAKFLCLPSAKTIFVSPTPTETRTGTPTRTPTLTQTPTPT